MDKLFFLLILTFSIVYVCGFWSSNKSSYLVQFIFVLLVSLFFGFRSDVSGSDTGTYLRYFNSIADLNKTHNFEFGFEAFSEFLISVSTEDVYLFLIVLIQVCFLYFSFLSIRLKNPLACFLLFIAFIPGLDLISSAIRSFLAASVGAFIFCVSINRRRLRLFNFLPVIFHFSYFLIPVLSLIPIKKISVTLIKVIFYGSIFNFIFLLFVDFQFLGALLSEFTSGYGAVSKLVRYILLENELLSPLVRFYFSFVSVVLSSVLVYILTVQEDSKDDNVYFSLVVVSIFGQAFFSLVSFTDFAYRFYYVYYTLHIIAVVYGLSLLSNKKRSLIIYFSILFLGLISTYGTNKFSNYSFFGNVF